MGAKNFSNNFSQNTNNWNKSNVTDMNCMFNNIENNV